MKKVCIHNGTDEQKTLSALRRAGSQATGKARGVIQGLAKALSHNPAARGRNDQGDASMAKKRTKRATAKRRTTHNPTTPIRRKRYTKRRYNPTGLAARVKSLDLSGLLMESAGVTVGGLATSFASRQAARIAPDMNPSLRTALATAVVGGAFAYFGKGKGFLHSAAVGSLSGGLTQLAATLAPGLFGSVDGLGGAYPELNGWNPDGTWNEELGAYPEDMGGVLYDTAGATPSIRSF